MKYHLSALIQQFENAAPIDFLFFWGHRPSRDGRMNQSCLSQWWQQGFQHEGIYYRTAEHWMMAEKARLFQDQTSLPLILKANTPLEAKKMGRKVKGFELDTWQAHAYEIVKKGNLYKFSQHAALRAFLLSTGEKVLVEASPYDQIWGIGLAKEAPQAKDPRDWLGTNLLGFALMEVRDQLREAAA
ncbi:MAG: NADAR family protein [Saprospiraceae bacterium]|nr:NADAR family protein [Saprospiraceae bacterium]